MVVPTWVCLTAKSCSFLSVALSLPASVCGLSGIGSHWLCTSINLCPTFPLSHICGSVWLVPFRPDAWLCGFCVSHSAAESPWYLFWFQQAWACCPPVPVVLRLHRKQVLLGNSGMSTAFRVGAFSPPSPAHLPLPSAPGASGTLALPHWAASLQSGLRFFNRRTISKKMRAWGC